MGRHRIIDLPSDRDGHPIAAGVIRWEVLHFGERLGYYTDGAVILCDALDVIAQPDGTRAYLVSGAVERLPAAARPQREAIAADATLLLRATARGFVTRDGAIVARSVIAGDSPLDDEVKEEPQAARIRAPDG